MQKSQQISNRQLHHTYRNQYYVDGNTARELDVVKELKRPAKKQDLAQRRKRDRMRYMNLPYVLFLCCAVAITGIVLVGYLKKQSEMTVQMERVAAMESQLNDMRLKNDEKLQRINSSIDMDEIKRIAVEELGMTYAKEGQVVSISGEGSDYVRQFKSLPNE